MAFYIERWADKAGLYTRRQPVFPGRDNVIARLEIDHALRTVSRNLTGGPTGGSFTVSLIEGGSGINIVPESCAIHYDQRTVPGDSAESVAGAIEQALDQIRAARHDVLIERPDPDLVVAPLNTSSDSAIVIAAKSAAASLDQNPEPTLVPYGSDASALSAIGGIPCIVYGPGSITHAHSADEFVPLHELNAAAQFYERTAHAFGRKEQQACS